MSKYLLNKYSWVLGLPQDTTFVVFDTETTGLDPLAGKVIEIGAIKFSYKKPIDEFGTLINPECKIPWQVTKVNNITDEMVKDSPKGPEVFPKFLEFIGDAVLIAHNAKFDIDFVNAELDRLGLPRMTNRVIDTRWMSKDFFPKEANYKLQTLAESFKIQVLDAHRATDDSRVCMKLFLYCVRALFKTNRELATAS